MTSSNKSEQIILAIDPGTVVSGYGVLVVTGNKYRAIDYGAIRPKRGDKISRKYLAIFDSIESLLKKYTPSQVVVETQFVKKNVQSALKLGMARGAVLVAAAKQDVPIFEYSPAMAKKAVVGNGQASKQQVQLMVQRLLCLKSLPEPEDAADALALAICHAQSLNHPRKSQQEV